MHKLDTLSIRPVAPNDLDMIRGWRNDPKVASFMKSQHEITKDEHSRWFHKMAEVSTSYLMIVEEAGLPIGFVNFSGAEKAGIAEWGFYASPLAEKGSGSKIGKAALDFAFHELQLHKLCGEVLVFNHGSIRLHEKLGFAQEGILRRHCLVNGEYHDLVVFGILRDEWVET